MSDTNSFLDAMQRRTGSHCDDEDDDGSSFGDGASPKDDDDGTGVQWQYDAENPPPPIGKGTAEEDDDEVVAIQPPSDTKADDDEDFSDDDSSDEDEPAKAKPAKKGRATAAKESSQVPSKGPKQAVSSAPKPMTGGRIKWAKLVQEEVYEDGTTKTTYPFIEKEYYYLDELAVQVMIEEAPHMAGYGKGKDAWLKAAIKLRRQQDPTGKVALPTITPKKLKARFDAWMSFVPVYRSKAQRNSGTDDDLANNTVLDAIETMYDEKEAGAAVVSGKRAVDAKKTANDKAGAEYIKCKAAGIPVPKEVVAVLNDTSPEEGSSDESKLAQSGSKKRRVSTVSALTTSTQKGTKPTASTADNIIFGEKDIRAEKV